MRIAHWKQFGILRIHIQFNCEKPLKIDIILEAFLLQRFFYGTLERK